MLCTDFMFLDNVRKRETVFTTKDKNAVAKLKQQQLFHESTFLTHSLLLADGKIRKRFSIPPIKRRIF